MTIALAPAGDTAKTVRGREVSARLEFAVGGGRTEIARQTVPYPFHITRPFWLDHARPDFATLYLQSASGGLYRDDRLALSVVAGANTAAQITTQSATVVHDSHGLPARQSTRIRLHQGAMLAYTPDPLILFPGGSYAGTMEIVLAPHSAAILAEGVAAHDPGGEGRSFSELTVSTLVRDATGNLLVADRAHCCGAALFGDASPLGPHRAFGSLLVLAPGRELSAPDDVKRMLDPISCFGAVSRLPNRAGLGFRILAENGGALACGLNACFRWSFEALLGFPPAARRK